MFVHNLDESSVGLLYSAKDEWNVGKSLTLEILAKGQGVASRLHPTLIAGGDQHHTGTTM